MLHNLSGSDALLSPISISKPQKEVHSRPMRNQMKMKGTLTGPVQDKRAYLKDSKYILFKILVQRIRKGPIWLAWPAGASTALPCPMS